MKLQTAINGDYGELTISGTIGTYPDEISLNDIDQALNSLKGAKRIRGFINSGGGDAFEGVAIHNRFRRDGRSIEFIIDGLAASAASLIAMAGDHIIVPKGAFVMVHDTWTIAAGDSGRHKHTAEVLGKLDSEFANIYADRTGLSISKVRALMAAETWMNGEDALSLGFADETSNYASAKAADVSQFKYRNTPAVLYQSSAPHVPRPANWLDVEIERFIDTPPKRKGLSKASHRALTKNADTLREAGISTSPALQRFRALRKLDEIRHEFNT